VRRRRNLLKPRDPLQHLALYHRLTYSVSRLQDRAHAKDIHTLLLFLLGSFRLGSRFVVASSRKTSHMTGSPFKSPPSYVHVRLLQNANLQSATRLWRDKSPRHGAHVSEPFTVRSNTTCVHLPRFHPPRMIRPPGMMRLRTPFYLEVTSSTLRRPGAD